ncbi:hypothetical protein II906_07945 [bacterium]|nr:hypothetical protein [bacterium]
MNPRLIKFTVELQNDYEKEEKTHKDIYFKKLKFFNFFRPADVTVPIKEN